MAEDYATTSDVIARFNDGDEVLHLLDNAAGTTSDATSLARLRAGIYRAQGEVDGYLARRYNVPVDVSGDTNLDNTLTQITTDLAMFYLVSSRSEQVSESLKALYVGAVAWLDKVATGVIDLPSAEPLTTGDSHSIKVDWGGNDAASTSNRLFNRANQANL